MSDPGSVGGILLRGAIIAGATALSGGSLTMLLAVSTVIAAYDTRNMTSGSSNSLEDGVAKQQAGITINQTGTESSLPIVYGRAKIGVSIVDIREGAGQSVNYGSANTLALVGAIAVAPEGSASVQGIEEISSVYFNDTEAISGPIFGTNDSSNNPTPFNHSKIKTPWNGDQTSSAGKTFGTHYWLDYFIHDGDDSQVKDYRLNAEFSTAWGTYARGVGVCYIVLWMYYNEDVYVNGLPNVTMTVKGNKVADVTALTAAFRYSENPADCIYDYMTSTRYGLGIPAASIDAAQTALPANPIATTNTSSVITVTTSAAHSLSVGQSVFLSGAAAVGGIDANKINVTHTVASPPLTTTFTVDTGHAAPSTVAAGGGSSATFDTSSFGLAADYCNDQVTITLTSGTATLDPRFSCNGFLDSAEGPLRNLERLLSSCCGRIVYEGGKYKLAIRKTTSAETFELNRTNIVGGWRFIKTGLDQTPNTMVATFIDVNQNYQPQEITYPEPGATNSYLTADNNFRSDGRLELPFTDDLYRAEMIAAQTLIEKRADMGCTLVAQREALKLAVGDVVNVNHDTPNWTDQTMWVEGVGLRRDGLVDLALKEYDSSAYTPPTMFPESTLVAAGLPDRYASADSATVAVLNVSLNPVLQSGTTYHLEMSLSFSGGMGSYVVRHEPPPGTVYEYTTDYTGTSTTVDLLENPASGTDPFEFNSASGSVTGLSTITITPYPEASAAGIKGTALTVTFQISEDE